MEFLTWVVRHPGVAETGPIPRVPGVAPSGYCADGLMSTTSLRCRWSSSLSNHVGVKPVEPMACGEVGPLADAKVHVYDLLGLIIATMDPSHITVAAEMCPGFVRSTAPRAPAVAGVALSRDGCRTEALMATASGYRRRTSAVRQLRATNGSPVTNHELVSPVRPRSTTPVESQSGMPATGAATRRHVRCRHPSCGSPCSPGHHRGTVRPVSRTAG